ncbi:MAG TPA: hypothetical protein VFS63_06900 [Pseudolabrys sp.]|jgi:hypothetical protein|nr:hypothetical protein [Pseudolabrys sp.]
MRLSGLATILAAAAVAGFFAAPADAAPKKRQTVAAARGNTYVSVRDENGRRRTRIIVQRRSYLDPGTEVLPYSQSSFDYAVPPTFSPTQVIDKTTGNFGNPLHGPFDIPSKNNPWQWP